MEALAVMMVVFGFLLATLLVVMGTSIVYGITLSVLWGWFIAPTFGLPPLGIAEAIGLSVVVGYLMPERPHAEQPAEAKPESPEAKRAALGKSVATLFRPIGRALGVLAFGWAVHRFFM